MKLFIFILLALVAVDARAQKQPAKVIFHNYYPAPPPPDTQMIRVRFLVNDGRMTVVPDSQHAPAPAPLPPVLVPVTKPKK